MTTIEVTKPDPEETQSGAARVLTFFRDRLLSGELKAGDRLLPERELALALDVSRPVLREALRSLAMLGLLDIQHGRGAFVRSADASVLGQALTLCLAPEPNILDDVLQARIAIECQAIRLACERASERDLQAIAGTLDTLVDSLDDPERGGERRLRLPSRHRESQRQRLADEDLRGDLAAPDALPRRASARHLPRARHHLGPGRRASPTCSCRSPTAIPTRPKRGLRDHFAIGDELRRRNLISAYQPPAQPKRKRS